MPGAGGRHVPGAAGHFISQIHVDSRGTYGRLRVHAELRLGRGVIVGHNQVGALMANAGPTRAACPQAIPDMLQAHHRIGSCRPRFRAWFEQWQIGTGETPGLTVAERSVSEWASRAAAKWISARSATAHESLKANPNHLVGARSKCRNPEGLRHLKCSPASGQHQPLSVLHKSLGHLPELHCQA
jgi:hypothetical protein